MSTIPRPDHSERPFSLTTDALVRASCERVFAAWCVDIDRWFAQPGTVVMPPATGQPYFFYNRDEWGRHPHYGRMLAIIPNRLLEMTWITGNGETVGTEGAETILRIELVAEGDATRVRLTHSGFVSTASCKSHEENWPLALQILDDLLAESPSC